MTVKELIKKLKTFEPEIEVYVDDPESEDGDVYPIYGVSAYLEDGIVIISLGE